MIPLAGTHTESIPSSHVLERQSTRDLAILLVGVLPKDREKTRRNLQTARRVDASVLLADLATISPFERREGGQPAPAAAFRRRFDLADGAFALVGGGQELRATLCRLLGANRSPEGRAVFRARPRKLGYAPPRGLRSVWRQVRLCPTCRGVGVRGPTALGGGGTEA